MASVHSDILTAFYEKLSRSTAIDPSVLEALRKALASGKKLKADDIAAILAKPTTDLP